MNQTAGEQSIPGLRGAVLVVDEDIEYLDFVRSVVQGVGCGIWACNSYVEGIRQLGSARFVAIVGVRVAPTSKDDACSREPPSWIGTCP